MEIIGFQFNKINIEKFKNFHGELKINSNLQINSIKKESLELFGNKPALKFIFTTTIIYDPDKFAEIIFSGEITALFEGKQSDEILKKWKKKKIDEQLRVRLFNFILSRCNLKALQLEQDLNLPPHLPLPRISHNEQTTQNNNHDKRGYVG